MLGIAPASLMPIARDRRAWRGRSNSKDSKQSGEMLP
jgi:hypothetical protein